MNDLTLLTCCWIIFRKRRSFTRSSRRLATRALGSVTSGSTPTWFRPNSTKCSSRWSRKNWSKLSKALTQQRKKFTCQFHLILNFSLLGFKCQLWTLITDKSYIWLFNDNLRFNKKIIPFSFVKTHEHSTYDTALWTSYQLTKFKDLLFH